VNTTHRPDDEFSADERRLLGLWRAPAPKAGFVARVVARAARERGGHSSTRGMAAVAALALLVLGGLFTARLIGVAADGGPAGGPRRIATADGGVRPEVLPPSNGVDI
jgi:hypothetical protein